VAALARRAWARNPAALAVAAEYNQAGGRITLPYLTEEDVIDRLVAENYVPGGK